MEKSSESYTDVSQANNLDFGRNTEIVSRHEIKDTPFRKIVTEEGCFIALGDMVITGRMNEHEAELKGMELQKTDWRLMMSIIAIIAQKEVADLHIKMMAAQMGMEVEGE